MSDNRHKRVLRQGFTTGTAAAASAKAALMYLISQDRPEVVQVSLLNGETMNIPLDTVETDGSVCVATVIKDAGDDPDITHGARIGARVKLLPGAGNVRISGGKGVGLVTKPGLEIPAGDPAINPGPRKMIRQSVEQVLTAYNRQDGVHVEIFVENGEILAKKTLNHRLGIEGGLSILGTTGRVKPLSHEAYTATIRSAMSVARACGAGHVVLTTGRRTEKYAQSFFPDLPEQTFIQIGDFFQMSMGYIADQGFPQVTLSVFFGKALKMAQGFPHTHAAKSGLIMDWLAGLAGEITGNKALTGKISRANTARHAFGMVYPKYPKVLEQVGFSMIRWALKFCNGATCVRAIIFDFDGNVAFDSDNTQEQPQ